jgi:hypothetical protein
MPSDVLKVARFEKLVSGQTYFCELTLDGTKVWVFSGRLKNGETIRIHEKRGFRFATEQEAASEFERRRSLQQRDKSMTETASLKEAPLFSGALHLASNGPLEAAIRNQSSGAERVWADFLIQHGDVRGELAALHQAGKGPEAEAFLQARLELFFSAYDVNVGSEIRGLQFETGVLREVALRRFDFESKVDLSELTSAVLNLPLMAFVDRLRFGLPSYESDNSWTKTFESVCASKQAPHIREIHFNDYTYEDCELSWTPFGDFTGFWARVPMLEHFTLKAGVSGILGDLSHAHLKSFVRESGGLSADEIESITAAHWPQLEKLEIWFGSNDYGAQGNALFLAPLLTGQRVPKLKSLGLVNCEFVAESIAALATSTIVGQLERLDLSKGALIDQDVDVVLKHADALKHLKSIDFSGNQLGERASEIAKRLPQAILSSQRERDASDEPSHRYVAVGE